VTKSIQCFLFARASIFRLFRILKYSALNHNETVCLSLTLKRKKATMPRYQLLANTDIIQHSKNATMGTKKFAMPFGGSIPHKTDIS